MAGLLSVSWDCVLAVLPETDSLGERRKMVVLLSDLSSRVAFQGYCFLALMSLLIFVTPCKRGCPWPLRRPLAQPLPSGSAADWAGRGPPGLVRSRKAGRGPACLASGGRAGCARATLIDAVQAGRAWAFSPHFVRLSQ